MRTVVALGGNALLRRGEPLTAKKQRQNVGIAAAALAPLAREHRLVITHGNGPQIGLLALQQIGNRMGAGYPLDVLDAETEGMIGYLLEQELMNRLPDRDCATLLTQVEVDPQDPAFRQPSKPIGPVYSREEADRLAAEHGWDMARDGAHYRRVVPSPAPQRILELSVIERLNREGVIVICAGGGGIPAVRGVDGRLAGVEAVIDKDLASSLLARELQADALLMLTDVDAVYEDWGGARPRAIRRISPQRLQAYTFEPGSMGPKVAAAMQFVTQSGGIAGIGRLEDAAAILRGEAGTLVSEAASGTAWWNRH
jgi:carbamate kinase